MLFLVLGVAAFTRFWSLATHAADTAATGALRGAISIAANDVSPLHDVLAALSRTWGGLPLVPLASAGASLGIVFLTYRIARSFVARREAILAAAIVAVSPFQIAHAHSGGPSAPAAALVLWAFSLFLRAAHDDRFVAWIPYGLVSALALYAHPVALLGVGIQAAYLPLDGLARRNASRWLGAQAAAFALFAPWLITRGLSIDVGLPLHGRDYVRIFEALAFTPSFALSSGAGAHASAVIPTLIVNGLLVALPLIPLVFALGTFADWDRPGAAVRLSVLGLVVPLVIVAAIRSSLAAPEYFVFASTFLALLLARGISSVAPAVPAYAWSVLFFGVCGYAWWDEHGNSLMAQSNARHMAAATALKPTGYDVAIALVTPTKRDSAVLAVAAPRIARVQGPVSSSVPAGSNARSTPLPASPTKPAPHAAARSDRDSTAGARASRAAAMLAPSASAAQYLRAIIAVIDTVDASGHGP